MPLLRFYAYEVYVCNIRIPESRSFEGKYLKPTMCVLSHFSRVRLLGTPWDLALQASLSMGFSQQENWSGLLWLPPGDPPNPRIEPASPALQAYSFTTEPQGNLKAHNIGFPKLAFKGIVNLNLNIPPQKKQKEKKTKFNQLKLTIKLAAYLEGRLKEFIIFIQAFMYFVNT